MNIESLSLFHTASTYSQQCSKSTKNWIFSQFIKKNIKQELILQRTASKLNSCDSSKIEFYNPQSLTCWNKTIQNSLLLVAAHGFARLPE